MKLHLLAIVASTALIPVTVQAQTPSPSSGAAQAGQPGAQLSAADFARQAAVSNQFEIQSSQLAVQQAQNDPVRQFAQRMIKDHTAAGTKMKAAVQNAQGITIPNDLDAQHQQMLKTLQSASGAGFDRAYVQMQVNGHRSTVNLFDRYAQSGDNAQLKQFAQQTLPTLRDHLQEIEKIQSGLPPAQVGAADGQQQTAQDQGGQGGSQIVVHEPAPRVAVSQAAPQVTVRQAQPDVTVRQAQPEILVNQPAPTVRVDIPQPEITVRMPRPDVNVAQAQPQVEVHQPQPQVRVQQAQQPQVQVERAQPQVQIQRQANAQPDVQVQQTPGQPTVRYQRAQPRVIVNQAQGEPHVRIVPMDNQQASAQPDQQQPNAQAQAQNQSQNQQQAAVSGQSDNASPQETGALPTGAALPVSRVTDMNLYNARGNELGDVERVVQGQDGRQYIVIGAGGFLGIGERKVQIPTDQVAVQGDRLIIRGVTEDQIRSMPAFDRKNGSYRELSNNQQVQISAMR